MEGSKSKYTEKDFLEMFREVKGREKGRKSTTRALVGSANTNFRKLVKAGYTAEEFERATIAMFKSHDQWAVSNGKDIPEHLLRPDNFSSYLNAAENPTAKKEDPNKIVLNAPQKKVEHENEIVEYTEEEIEKSKSIYSESLLKERWIGSILDAMKIGKMFSNSFSIEEKHKFLKDANDLIVSEQNETTRTATETPIQALISRMASKYPKNVMFELAVKEAVKRKIVEPWI